MCYPYGMGVSCICDARGRIYKCFPNLENLDDPHHQEEALMSSRDGRDDGGMLGGDDVGMLDSLTGGSSSRSRGLDERTEIILAATFLVLVILTFIR